MRTFARALLAISFASFAFAPAFASAAMVDINTADANALDTLPGIGPTKAAAIIAYRDAHGLFAKIEDLENVKGVGPATFDKLKAFVTVATVPASAPAVQPAAHPPRSQQVQKVDSAVSSATIEHSANAVVTATAAPEVAAVALVNGPPEPAVPPRTAFLRSPWLIGLLGILAAGGGALLVL